MSSALPPSVSDNDYIASRFAHLCRVTSFMESIKFSMVAFYLVVEQHYPNI